MTPIRILVSLAYWAAVAVIGFLFSNLVIVLSFLLYPIDPTRRMAELAAMTALTIFFRLNPRWRLEVLGEERLRSGGPFVICANHQSFVDVFALGTLRTPWRWVAKRSLFSIPFFGWGMFAAGHVAIVRGDKASGARTIEACKRWLARGVSILMFPEGTRSRDGELLPFKHGAFTIALASGAPILPIAIDGSRDALRKGGFDVASGADVVLSILPPIDAGPYRAANDVDGLRNATRDAIAREIAALRNRAVTGTSRSP